MERVLLINSDRLEEGFWEEGFGYLVEGCRSVRCYDSTKFLRFNPPSKLPSPQLHLDTLPNGKPEKAPVSEPPPTTYTINQNKDTHTLPTQPFTRD